MKKYIFLLSLTMAGMLSCSKTEIISTPSIKTEATPKMTRSHQVGKTESKPCGGAGTGCIQLDTIVVHGTIAQFQKFHELALMNGNAVKEFFLKEENSNLLISLDPAIKNKIISGNYKLVIDFEDDLRIDVCFGTAQDLTFSNSEFTLEYGK